MPDHVWPSALPSIAACLYYHFDDDLLDQNDKRAGQACSFGQEHLTAVGFSGKVFGTVPLVKAGDNGTVTSGVVFPKWVTLSIGE